VDLDALGIQPETLLLIDEELLHHLALVTLELDDLAHLAVSYDGAIASELLLNDLEDFLLVKFLWKTLNSSQSLSAIALLDPYMDVVLRLFGLSSIFVGFGEGVVGLEIFN